MISLWLSDNQRILVRRANMCATAALASFLVQKIDIIAF
jgi:hypothetical protein